VSRQLDSATYSRPSATAADFYPKHKPRNASYGAGESKDVGLGSIEQSIRNSMRASNLGHLSSAGQKPNISFKGNNLVGVPQLTANGWMR